MTSVDLGGQVAIVTGGGGGVGREIAKQLAEAGVTVAVFDIDIVEANRTVAQIREDGGKALSLHCDVRHEETVGSAVLRMVLNVGPPAILVNAVGIWMPEDFAEAIAQMAEELLGVNFEGYVTAMQAAWLYMEDRRTGVIVNISPVRTSVHSDLCSLARRRVEELTVMLAKNGADRSIRVYSVDPDAHELARERPPAFIQAAVRTVMAVCTDDGTVYASGSIVPVV